MTIKTALQELRKLHDSIKEHPYWTVFNHGMLKNDLIPMYREIMEIYSYLRHNQEYEYKDSPWLAMMSTIYHDFNAMLGTLNYKDVQDSEYFKVFYLPTLQNFLQILHFFIEGMNTEENIIMFMPTKIYRPTHFTKYTCVYHDSWKDSTNYQFWFSNDYKWKAITTIKEKDVDKYLSTFKNKINSENTSKGLKECYEHYIMDLENKTSLVYKIE